MLTVPPGVDVMITIFCDFRQFLAKKLAFFSNTNVMIKTLHNLALFWVKNASFCNIFRRRYFKNYNIGPRCTQKPTIGSAVTIYILTFYLHSIVEQKSGLVFMPTILQYYISRFRILAYLLNLIRSGCSKTCFKDIKLQSTSTYRCMSMRPWSLTEGCILIS
jgi:hypothetical protein